MATIHMIPTKSTHPLLAFWPIPFAPKRRKTYCPAIWARLAMTRMSAAMMPQPPHQPVFGPKARAPK